MNMLQRALAMAFWLALAVPQTAAATPPAAYGSFNTDRSETVYDFPAGRSFACGTASISATPLPVLSTAGTDCGDPLQAILIYYFEITGPADTIVPISVASSHALIAGDQAQAGFSLTVAGSTIDIGNCYFGALAACGTQASTTHMSLMANKIYGVSMMTIVSNFLGPGSGSALLDPSFSFDSSDAAAAGYAFAFSPGIGNGVTAAVPEPEAISMMALGIAALAAWRRRRQGR